MARKTVSVRVALSADVYEVLNEICRAYVADKLAPISHENISEALEKAAKIYIAAAKAERPDLRELIEGVERRYAQAETLRLLSGRKRGRPPKRRESVGGAGARLPRLPLR